MSAWSFVCADENVKGMAMSGKISLVLVVSMLLCAGCTDSLLMLGASDPGSVRVYLVNTSSSRFVSPNIGLCPQGLANQPHNFLEAPPMLGPGESISYTTRQIGGADGVCTNASAQFMVGLCGWTYGPTAEDQTRQDQKFGGQIGYQFNCGDTVILRWADGGPACGTWTSEVLTAPGNTPATAPFQLIDTGGTCSG